MYTHMEYVDEDDMWEKEAADPGSYDHLVTMKKEYDFSKLVFLHHMGVEACTENRWGEYRAFNRPINVYDYQDGEVHVLDSGYVLCDGYKWDIKTKGSRSTTSPMWSSRCACSSNLAWPIMTSLPSSTVPLTAYRASVGACTRRCLAPMAVPRSGTILYSRSDGN